MLMMATNPGPKGGWMGSGPRHTTGAWYASLRPRARAAFVPLGLGWAHRGRSEDLTRYNPPAPVLAERRGEGINERGAGGGRQRGADELEGGEARGRRGRPGRRRRRGGGRQRRLWRGRGRGGGGRRGAVGAVGHGVGDGARGVAVRQGVGQHLRRVSVWAGAFNVTVSRCARGVRPPPPGKC